MSTENGETINTRETTALLGVHRSTLTGLVAKRGPLEPAVVTRSRAGNRYDRRAIEVAARLRAGEPEKPETIGMREALRTLECDRSTLSPLIQPGGPLACLVAGRGPGRRLRFWRVGVEVAALAARAYLGFCWARWP